MEKCWKRTFSNSRAIDNFIINLIFAMTTVAGAWSTLEWSTGPSKPIVKEKNCATVLVKELPTRTGVDHKCAQIKTAQLADIECLVTEAHRSSEACAFSAPFFAHTRFPPPELARKYGAFRGEL
jgi:hypothetical protein